MVAFVLIGVAAYAKVTAYIVDISVMGGIISCGVFLLIIACVGIVGTVLHHQVTLFFVSFNAGQNALSPCTLGDSNVILIQLAFAAIVIIQTFSLTSILNFNTVTLCPLTLHIMPCYTHKMAIVS